MVCEMDIALIFVCLAASFAVSAFTGKLLIPFLTKLHFGQNILVKDGPSWHASKQGTPTMGGFCFIISTVITYLIFAFPYYSKGLDAATLIPLPTGVMTGLIVACLFSLMGFADDFVKIAKKRNLGLSAMQKIILQILISAAYLIFLSIRTGGRTSMLIPFTDINLELSYFYYVLAMIIMVGFVNAVNLTDGVDGLASGVTLPVCIFFAFASFITIRHFENAFLASALAGGLIGFLLYNKHPAKMFMGDTGSMFLGGMVCILAFELNIPLILPIVGIIYLIEAFSVMIQVTYFKLTHGKRLFKMTPIHHHFEMSGYSENKIVAIFSSITVAACIAVGLWLYL